MRVRALSAAAAALAGLLVFAPVFAQTPAAPDTRSVVPDKMPFDIPYGAPISAGQAGAVIEAAIAEARRRDWKVNIAVVDSGANLVAFERMDGAQLASIEIAQHKARAAVMFRRDTRVYEDGVQSGLVYQLTLDGLMASRGGIPLIADGRVVGAVGVSGGAASQDEVVAKAAAASFKG